MRDDLSAVLDELAPRIDDAGLGLDGSPIVKRPPVKDRAALWDLAVKLGRELGTEIDPGPAPVVGPGPRPRGRRGPVDYGGA